MADLSQRLCPVPEKFLSSKIDDELILIQGDSGAFYSLTDIGLEIWEQMDAETTLAEITFRLTQRYDVEQSECSAAVAQFAYDLVQAGLAEYA